VDTVLELRALTKHFPTHRAVNGVAFALQRGEFFSLLGPSGCGKTTTLRLIAGFETPTSGEILLNGRPVANLKPYERNVNTVFQNYALFPHLTVARNIRFGLERRRPRMPAAEISAKVDRMLSMLQLSGKEDRMPGQISGGERQRVALARSLVLEPDVLLLDEPLSALDPKLRKQVRAELKGIQRRVGIAFLFVTHDQEEALSLSDRIAVMNRGELEQVGPPRELYQTPASRFVAEFLGDVNWIDGAAIRPECLRISRDRPVNGACAFPAVVMSNTYLGDCVHIEMCLESGGRCVAQVNENECRYETGQHVYVWWRQQDQLPIAVEQSISADA
jgi:ABC-type Fe3+/spermidine/putrescine transport system ATPase subunit